MIGRLKYWLIAGAFGILPLTLLAFLARPATAATGLWYVAPGGSDAADCQTTSTPCKTINAALGKAAPGDTVEVASGTYTASSGDEVVWVTQSVTLLGGWNSGFTAAPGVAMVDGQGVRRGMSVSSTVTATADRFAFRNGYNGSEGGGIYSEGVLTVTHSQVNNSRSSDGGGIYNYDGALTLIESQLIGNHSDGNGGGLTTAFAQVTIISSTIRGNYAGNPCCTGGGGGAGIDLFSGSLTLLASTVSDNVLLGGFEGAGIRNGGTLTVTNSTISNNSGGDGAGIYSFVTTQAFYNATITGNSGGGLSVTAGHAVLKNTIMSGNGFTDCYNDSQYAGTVTSLGYNLIERAGGCGLTGTDITGVSANLGALQDNGGPAATQAILPGSPAINGGNPTGCMGPNGLLDHDSRGQPRAGRCDIGAFELQLNETFSKAADRRSAAAGTPIQFILRLFNPAASAAAGLLATDTLPANLHFITGTLVASAGQAMYANGVITWTGSVSGGQPGTIQYEAASSPATISGTVITNPAVLNNQGKVVQRQASVTIGVARLFLPLFARPEPGIQGHVTLNGAPLPGIWLELRLFDGQQFSTALMAATISNGNFNFLDAPSLLPGQFYYVRYLNTFQNTDRLSYWATAEITHYVHGDSFGIGAFDLADIPLVAPDPGAKVALPSAFQWTRRSTTPSDSYQLSLFDPGGSAFGQTPPLGYVNGVTLTGVLGGFQAGHAYGWYVAVNAPDGGYGESFYYRRVTFNNVLAPSLPASAEGVAIVNASPMADRPPR